MTNTVSHNVVYSSGSIYASSTVSSVIIGNHTRASELHVVYEGSDWLTLRLSAKHTLLQSLS